MKKNILISGAGGFLGWNLCRKAQDRYNVTGTTRNFRTWKENVPLIQCDLTDKNAVANLVDKHRPDIIIHAAAASDPNYCQEHPIDSAAINVETPAMLADICSRKGIAFLFTSTDLVFNGNTGNYNENSATDPLSLYGRQKLKAEKGILSVNSHATICRMPLMFGDAPEGSVKFLQQWICSLRSGMELTLFYDEYRTPVSATDACSGILLFCEKECGIIHLGGKERLSRYELGCMIAEVGGFPISKIKRCSLKDITMAAPRPKDVSLDSSRAFAAGYNPGKIRDELEKTVCLKK